MKHGDVVRKQNKHRNLIQSFIMQLKAKKQKLTSGRSGKYSTVQFSSVQYSTVRYGSLQYSTVQYSAVQCSTVHFSTVQYGTVSYLRYMPKPLSFLLPHPSHDGEVRTHFRFVSDLLRLLRMLMETLIVTQYLL